MQYFNRFCMRSLYGCVIFCIAYCFLYWILYWGRFQYWMSDQNQLDFINGQLCYLAIQVIICCLIAPKTPIFKCLLCGNFDAPDSGDWRCTTWRWHWSAQVDLFATFFFRWWWTKVKTITHCLWKKYFRVIEFDSRTGAWSIWGLLSVPYIGWVLCFCFCASYQWLQTYVCDQSSRKYDQRPNLD